MVAMVVLHNVVTRNLRDSVLVDKYVIQVLREEPGPSDHQVGEEVAFFDFGASNVGRPCVDRWYTNRRWRASTTRAATFCLWSRIPVGHHWRQARLQHRCKDEVNRVVNGWHILVASNTALATWVMC